MPVDFSGVCFGLLVWLGGTVWVVVAARRTQATRPAEIPSGAVFVAGLAAAFGFFLVFVVIVVGYDLLTVLFRRALK